MSVAHDSLRESRSAWRVEPYCEWDKHIAIAGPGTLMLALYNDDVNPDDIRKGLPRILKALNEEDWGDV